MIFVTPNAVYNKGDQLMKRSQVLFAGAALLGVAALGSPAKAASLVSPNNQAPSSSNPSFYRGTTNPQDQFTVVLDGTTGIELGLSAHFAFVGPVVPPPVGSTYTVPTGVGSNGRAIWDYDFSIDLNPHGNTPGLTFGTAGIVASALLTVTDLTTGATGSYNPLTFLTDDDSYGSTPGTTLAGKHQPALPGDWGAQNSESLSFGFPALGFSPWNGDSYLITLSVAGVTDSITVNAVPEPASMALVGAGLFALGVIRRRRA
jgi:hypothetical protein